LRAGTGLSWAAGSLLVASGLRRLAHRTGVSDEEAYASLPGDGVIAHPMLEWNRGITIAAPAEAIWPWLVQMGYGRAGWYTPEAFDRWMHRWVWRLEQTCPFQPSPWRILPEHQQIGVGDVIADGPRFAAYLRVMAVEPAQHLVYYSLRHPWRGKPVDPNDGAALAAREHELRVGGLYLEFSWAFVLRPVDAQRTRLLLRARNNVAPRRLAGLLDVPIGLVDVYEGGGMLRGIRARATQPA
jgi:hypothetical protein